MKKLTILFTILALSFSSCKKSSKETASPVTQISAKHAEHITGFTTGVISSQSTIKVRFAKAVEKAAQLTDGLFKISPAIEGSTSWIDDNTVAFSPKSALESGKSYKVSVGVDQVVKSEKSIDDFDFTFKVIPQNYEVELVGMITPDQPKAEKVSVTGFVETADFAENARIEKMFMASQGSENLKITWDHNAGKNKHTFTVINVSRGMHESTVGISWDGTPIGVQSNGQEDYLIPGLSDYKVVSTRLVPSSPNYISVLFSNPIDRNQNLDGFVKIGTQEPKIVIDGNELKLYPRSVIYGVAKLTIYKAVKNTDGHSLKDDFTADIQMPQSKPVVKLKANKGAIMPNSEGLILPFEAIGLKAVDVKIIRIFEDNVIQYLQVNNIGSTSQLNRVGRPVARKSVNLMESGVTNLNKWNRFTLDISDHIQIEPGALYQVELSFRKSQSLFFCGNDVAGDELATDDNWNDIEESSNWDWYEDNYGYYDWSERDNPCHDSYYRYKKVSKLLFASDLGLIAKRGDGNELHAFVTNLIDTKTQSGVELTVYDFQQQIVGNSTTDQDGKAVIKVKGKPFALMAKLGQQYGYLKLDDGSSLSLSNFNVSGQKIQKGIKGFIYGERGVWRPGDDIHLTFILEDKSKKLPEGYPVVMELKDPQGKMVSKKVNATGVSGMYNFSTNTSDDAPTGQWQAVVRAGGATFTKALRIEAVKPNRLKINLDFGKDRLTALDQSINGSLEVKWLHGAVAKNLRAQYDLLVAPIKTKFEEYPNFSFDDQSKDFYASRQEVFDGRLDVSGNAKMNVSIDVNDDPPGALTAIFTGKVFEEGGDFSVDKLTIPYFPYKSFVGLKTPEGDSRGMLLTDQDHEIRIVTVDANGEPVSRNGVEVELYKLNWRWWWDNSSDNLSYLGRRYRDPIQSGELNTRDGEGTWALNIKYPDWGRYYLKVTDPVSGHSAGSIVYADWPGWAGKGKREMGGVSMLNFEVEKGEYQVGDQVKLTFPSSAGARVLVSLETGKKVVKTFWVETQDESTSLEFEATPEMSPNVYAHITLVQPHAQTANDLPIRMYGVQSVSVIDQNTKLNPQLDMPSTLQPEQNFTVNVSEQNGKAMAYTIAMVDEGLLDLTKFKTPSPWNTFYAREALGIKTWDMFDEVIGAYGGQIERLLAIGGDGENDGPTAKKANRFIPVVRYIGPFNLEAGESASHNIQMPQYVGSVRTMIIAAGEGAYGSAEVTTPVKQPVMVLATLPRVAGPNEEMDMPVTVFVTDDNIKSVKVSVMDDGQLEIQGPKSKDVQFAEAGEQVVYFKAKARQALGFAKVAVTATAGSVTANHDIELNVRPSNPQFVDVSDKLVDAGSNWDLTYEPLGMMGTNEATIEVSSLPSLNLEQRLKYLIRYPHGCIEQTTSSVFAQLYLKDLTTVSSEMESRITKNINAAIERLKKFQTTNGGFSYWPGQYEESDWGTNYAGHFLLEAKSKGYAVPDAMLNNWIKFQKKQADRWSKGGRRNNDLIQAYRLYDLALAGEKKLGAMNRLKEMDGLGNVAKWKLALAYATAGYEDAANEIIEGLSKEVKDYTELSYTYGSTNRDRAMILETLAKLGRLEEAYPILDQIAKAMGDQKRWMSTQTTAYCLIGITAYTQGNTNISDIDFAVNVGTTVASFEQGKYVTQVVLDDADINAPLSIANNGQAPIYVRLIRIGIPIEGTENPDAKNISMDVTYMDNDGNKLNPGNIDQGTDFIAQVSVHNPGLRGDYEELALTQIFPSGWEIINTRLDGTDQFSKQDQPEYLDIRDDRVLMYFDLKANERKTFQVRLNAAYKGTYFMPAVAIEAMYDNTIYARNEGGWVNVQK